jgi:RNA polymerase sigma-70 factor (ECF subfamily)
MADNLEPRDIELMRRLSSGEEGAFLEFYRRHQGGVFRYAVHMTGRPEAAADVVQETFLTLMRQAGKFDEEKGEPASFLYGIARNHVRKFHEKEGRYVPFAEESGNGDGPGWKELGGNHNGNGHHAQNGADAETVVEALERAEAVQRLREAVLTLPEHYREPVTLCDLEGKSYSEVSVLLACPVGTVRSRLNRARSILLEKLRPSRVRPRALGAPMGGKP